MKMTNIPIAYLNYLNYITDNVQIIIKARTNILYILYNCEYIILILLVKCQRLHLISLQYYY